MMLFDCHFLLLFKISIVYLGLLRVAAWPRQRKVFPRLCSGSLYSLVRLV